jgi:hypothetical protein
MLRAFEVDRAPGKVLRILTYICGTDMNFLTVLVFQ